MSRKIVQISTGCCTSDGGGGYIITAALCDDGTVWEHGSYTGWQKLDAIPQDGPADDPREHRIRRHGEEAYLEFDGGVRRRLSDGWWIYEHTDTDADGQFDVLHRARATGAP